MTREDLVKKTIRWFSKTDTQVRKAGGSSGAALVEGMSDDTLYTMIANDLYVVYLKPEEEETS